MIVVLTITFGMALWIIGFAFGLKSFDVFMFSTLLVLIAAAFHLARPHIDQRLGRDRTRADEIGPPEAPGSSPG